VAFIRARSSEINAHAIDMTSRADVRRHLAYGGISEPEGVDDDAFLAMCIRLDVDGKAAKIIKSTIESLGGAAAAARSAGEADSGETGIVISASRRTLGILAGRLEVDQAGLGSVGAEIRSCLASENTVMRWGARELDFRRKTYVMGILNRTPDSFYPASRRQSLREAMLAASGMIEAGADIIDIGGESSRPGSDPVPADEEAERVVPVIREIRGLSDIMISVDTSKKEVAERALDAGADMINDITALRGSRDLAGLVAGRRVPIVLMHMRGTPKTMQTNPSYENAVDEILRTLSASISIALEAGISRELIIIDPGIGFGKRVQDNLGIIRDLGAFRSLNAPIMIGLSRKSFIGEITGQPVEKRLIGTVTANTLAVINGANIVRVHDVGEAVEMVKIIDSVRRIGE
jgi:dihydropteroate synthase